MAEPAARPVGRPRTSPAAEGYYAPDAVAARRAYMAAYKAANAEGLKTYYRAWRAANPEKHRQYNREWTARDRARRQGANLPPARAVEEPAARPEPPADGPREFVPE